MVVDDRLRGGALAADDDAEYDEVVEIDLDRLEPLIARPSSPDDVVPVREIAGTDCIGLLIDHHTR